MDADLIEKTRRMVETQFQGEASGHDWQHVYRVWAVARKLAKEEGAHPTIVELAALLHDIADWKFHDGDEAEGPKRARHWLEQNNTPLIIIDSVCEIIATLSYKGAGVATPMKTIEGQVVQDADRLDAIGAIGIARTFAYGGYKNRSLYDPDEPPVLHQNFEAYKNNRGHTINHFYEKLLLLKDRMNTDSAQRWAEKRHNFMERYLEQFFGEWNGEL